MRGPRLQAINLTVLYAVVVASVQYPNPLPLVALSVIVAATLDAAATRLRSGTWRIPWGTIIGTMGIWLLMDGFGWESFVLLPIILVGSKHLVRTASGHLFNANNLGAAGIILLHLGRVGVVDWGGNLRVVGLMVLFGTVATLRARRFRVAMSYLAWSGLVYFALALALHQGTSTGWAWAYSPLVVMVGFFAVTDPATSPNDATSQVLWTLLVVLLGVGFAMAYRPDGAVFALLVAAPQRHLVTGLVTRWRSRPTQQVAPIHARPVTVVEGGLP